VPRSPRGSLVLVGGVIQLPAVIEQAGERARRRFVEFFTAEIRNPHTRRAYGSAVGRFLGWCEVRGLTLGWGTRSVQPRAAPPVPR
jgi:hypothetical protein